MFVGAKHDRSQYKIITNNLYAVMLRPLQNQMHSKLEKGTSCNEWVVKKVIYDT
jgi:hypothetical protein